MSLLSMLVYLYLMLFRIHKAEHDKIQVVDVDGSYLHRKYQNMVSRGITASDPGVQAMPLTGWEQITEGNYKEMTKKIPKVTHGENISIPSDTSKLYVYINVAGLLYTYLAEGVGNKSVSGAFQALKHEFTHWASGRMDHLSVNYVHPKYCHVKCDMTPSMMSGLHHVYILLVKDGGGIVKATCECAAG